MRDTNHFRYFSSQRPITQCGVSKLEVVGRSETHDDLNLDCYMLLLTTNDMKI